MDVSYKLSLLKSPIFPDSGEINGKSAYLMSLTSFMVKELAESRGNMDFYPVEGLNFSDCIKIHDDMLMLFYDVFTADGKPTTSVYVL